MKAAFASPALVAAALTLVCPFPSAFAQKQCGNGQWQNVRTQADLQTLQGCTSYTGSLQLNGADIKDLSPLSSLATISLSLDIQSTGVTNLKGLGALRSIGDKFYVRANDQLATLEGIQSLSDVAVGIFIMYNSALRDISALSSVRTVNPNPNLFGKLTEDSYYGVHVVQNRKLASLNGLQSLAGGNELELNELPLVTDLSPLPAASGFTVRKLKLIRMNGLTDLSTMPAYKGSNDMEYTVTNCSALTSLKSPFTIAAAPGAVNVMFNEKLTDLEGLQAVKQWPAAVRIASNPALCDFKGLNTTILAAQPSAVVTNDCGNEQLKKELADAKASASRHTTMNAGIALFVTSLAFVFLA